MAKSTNPSVGRRGFLKGAAAGAAALVAEPVSAIARPASVPAPEPRPSAPLPTEAQVSRDTTATPAQVEPSRHVESPQSDFMVDVIKALGIEYVAANPGSSFEGLHESLVNYGQNTKPELLTCLHEESSVAMAHGYAKVEGKPMMVMLHGTIGIQHGSMAIYNAYADRVPIVMIAGLDNEGPIPAHNAIDMAAMVREFVKWDYQPDDLSQFMNGAFRAYKLAMTPPMAPILIVANSDIQKAPLGRRPTLPSLVMPSLPAADMGTVREIARLLIAAENPRVVAGRAVRTDTGLRQMVELAELLQMPVNIGGDRVNFPSLHPLGGTGDGEPDLLLMLEATGTGGAPQGVKRISISTAELLATHNYNINGSPADAAIVVAADTEATLPALLEELKRQMTPDRRALYQQRGAKHVAANRRAHDQLIESARYGWDSSPISTARVTAELWPLLKNEDWGLVSPAGFFSNWPLRMWNVDRHYRYIGGQGAAGMGYGAPASVGAALAHRKHGRIAVNIQCDGDLNYAPGVLWTAVHHKIPLLTIMHNNRGYHQEVMFLQQQCAIRNRGIDRAGIGTVITDPNINYAKMAEAYGMYSEGPIENPKDLGPALKRGIDRVKKGEPVMLDVITQPR